MAKKSEPKKSKPVEAKKSDPAEVFVVTTPHGEGMRVYGVYSSEESAQAALDADPRNRVESRVVDGDAE